MQQFFLVPQQDYPGGKSAVSVQADAKNNAEAEAKNSNWGVSGWSVGYWILCFIVGMIFAVISLKIHNSYLKVFCFLALANITIYIFCINFIPVTKIYSNEKKHLLIDQIFVHIVHNSIKYFCPVF